MTTKNDKLAREIEILEMDETADKSERQEELDWIVEQLTNMSDYNYKNFIKSVKHERKARHYRREMSSNA